MGRGPSRQTKELVPASRITKELGRPKADSCQLLVISCQKKRKPTRLASAWIAALTDELTD